VEAAKLTIEHRAVAAIVPYAGNARTHSPEQVAKIAASIKQFGFNNPILVDAEGTVVAGHGRLAAAKSLGLAEVPVVALGHLTEAARRAYTMADNRIALDAGWDEQLLARELAYLQQVGAIGLEVVGFTPKELDRLLKGAHGGSPGCTEPDAAPPAPEVPVSQAGDTWLLGGHHRLRCGSSTAPEDVAILLEGEKPHLMVTDPPYGVNYDPSWRAAAGVGSTGAATGRVLNDDQADWREAWRLFPGHVAYVWHGGLHGAVVQASLEACEFKVRAQIIWVKQRPVLSRGAYHWQHEPAFYASQGDAASDAWQSERFEDDHDVATYAVLDGETAKWAGGRKQSTVWHIEHVKNNTGHGTQKPVECMRRPIVNNSRLGEAVYEPFSGSGTTIIAAHVAGRRCFAMELNPAYVDVGVRRWQEFTGGIAILEGDGHSFEEVAATRGIRAAA
jgi:site-specific DNA-methyltransferase (adenine-specific)